MTLRLMSGARGILSILKVLKAEKGSSKLDYTMQNNLYKEAWYGHIYLQVTIYLILFVSEHAKIAAQDIDITNTTVDKIDFAALEQSLN